MPLSGQSNTSYSKHTPTHPINFLVLETHDQNHTRPLPLLNGRSAGRPQYEMSPLYPLCADNRLRFTAAQRTAPKSKMQKKRP